MDIQDMLISDDQLFEQAYQRVLPELEAFTEEVAAINVDIMSAVATAWGVMPELQALQAQLVSDLPKVNPRLFERLHDFALASAYAHTQHLVATEPLNNLRTLYEEGVKLREALLADARSLATRSLIPRTPLDDLQGAVGYKNVAQDLMMLTSVFRTNWSKVVGRVATTEDELKQATRLAGTLIRGVGLKEQGPANAAETWVMRGRAFTLFLRTYDETRQVVSFLRWRQGDVEVIIPSLWAGRGRRPTADGEAGPSADVTLVSGSEDVPAPAPAQTPMAPAMQAAPQRGVQDPFLAQ